jgi:heptosyltransferase-1
MMARLAIGALRVAANSRGSRSVRHEDVSSVALFELTGLGDVVSMLPAIHGFKTLFPGAELHLVVDSTLVELLRSLELPASVHGIVGSTKAPGVVAALQLVRSLRPTLACSMSPPRRNALVALASGAPAIAGYLRHTDSLTPYLVETPVEILGIKGRGGVVYGRNHISERALNICRALGLQDMPSPMKFAISASTADDVEFDLLLAGVLPRRGYVVVHPFAGWKFRRWPESSFIALVERLREAGVGNVVLLWEEEKDGKGEILRSHFAGDHHVLFASTLRLLESAVLLSGADAFVGNDSGPLHLAAALGVPAVGLFGPAPPGLTAPRSVVPSSWIYHGPECSPCDQRLCIRPDDPCMNAISVDEVFAAVIATQRRRTYA